MTDPFEEAMTVRQLYDIIRELPYDAKVVFNSNGYFEYVDGAELSSSYARDDHPILQLHGSDRGAGE